MRVAIEHEYNNRFLIYVLILIVGIPLTVIAAYYAAGWKLAVLMLPFLYWTLPQLQKLQHQRKNTAEKKPLTIRRLVVRAIWYFSLAILPTIAVLSDEVNYMRYWAYCLATFPFLISMSSSGRHKLGDLALIYDIPSNRANVFGAFVMIAVALGFVIVSDILWLFTSLSVWIWFHAFAIVIGFSLLLLGFVTGPFALGYAMKSDETKHIRGKPPKPANERDRNRYTTQHVRWDGAVRDFKELTIDQAITMFRRVRWQNEIEKQPSYYEITRMHSRPQMPRFIVSFNIWESISVYAEFDGTFYIECYVSAKGSYIFPKIRKLKATGVPDLLVPEIMRLAWIAQWEDVEQRLKPYRFEPA